MSNKMAIIIIAQNNLGNCLMEMPGCYDDALIHSKQSVEINRDLSPDERVDDNFALHLKHWFVLVENA